MTSCLVSISTSLFISTNLGSLATPATTYLLIGLTVLMNAKELIHVLVAYRAGNLLPVHCTASMKAVSAQSKPIFCSKQAKLRRLAKASPVSCWDR